MEFFRNAINCNLKPCSPIPCLMALISCLKIKRINFL